MRLGIHKKLERHRGCVNTVSFNPDGNILVSGSDDRMVILWDWDVGTLKLAFPSGHSNNVFQAKIMPYTNDRRMVTCAADGEVRYAQILEGGRVITKVLAQHDGRAHKLAIEPGSPHIFYSCGEDGLVQHFDLRTQSATPLVLCKSIHSKGIAADIQLNAIAIDPRNPNVFAVAGSEQFTRLYDVRNCKMDGSTDRDCPVDFFCPPHLVGNENVGITGVAFSEQSELLASYNDEFIYLFQRDQGLGTNPTLASPTKENVKQPSPNAASSSKPGPQVYDGHRNCDTVKGVSFFGPKCEYVASGSDCGGIFIWRKKDGKLLRVLEGDKHVVNCIEPHPFAPIMASSGIEHDIKMWIPNAHEPAVPVKKEELKRKSTRFCHFPEDILMRILELQRRLSRAEEGTEVVASGELVDLMMGNADPDDSEESGDTSDNPRDCTVQ